MSNLDNQTLITYELFKYAHVSVKIGDVDYNCSKMVENKSYYTQSGIILYFSEIPEETIHMLTEYKI